MPQGSKLGLANAIKELDLGTYHNMDAHTCRRAACYTEYSISTAIFVCNTNDRRFLVSENAVADHAKALSTLKVQGTGCAYGTSYLQGQSFDKNGFDVTVACGDCDNDDTGLGWADQGGICDNQK